MKYKYNTNKRVSCILYNLQCCIVFIYPPRANRQQPNSQQQKQHQQHWQQKLQNIATETESTEQQMATNVGYFAAWFAGWLAHWLAGHADNLSAAHLGQVRAISWAEHNDIAWKCLQMSCENLSRAALNSCAEAETQWKQQINCNNKLSGWVRQTRLVRLMWPKPPRLGIWILIRGIALNGW